VALFSEDRCQERVFAAPINKKKYY